MSRLQLTARWDRSPKDVIRRLQALKLRSYLRDLVIPFSPHYREVLESQRFDVDSIRTLEDLDQIPFTSKADLLNTPEHPQKAQRFVLRPGQECLKRQAPARRSAFHSRANQESRGFEAEFRPMLLISTTGRSADPIPILLSQYDIDNLSIAGERMMQISAVPNDFRVLNMLPYAPHLAFWFTHYAAIAHGVFSLSTGGGRTIGTDGNLRLLKQIKPHVLVGMPTFVYHVLQQMVESGIRGDSLKMLVLAGEKVADGLRPKLRDLAERLGSPNVQVHASYGFTEAKMSWIECPFQVDQPSAGYHLYPDLGLFEVIDPKTGTVVPEGCPGELVFTPLEARGSVVLRYRTGDLIDGGMVYKPCPHCGRTLPRLVGKISRSSEFRAMQLDKIKGTLVDFNLLEHVLDDTPNVGTWQLELRKRNDDPLGLDEIVLRVEKTNGVEEHRLRKELNRLFTERTEIQINQIFFHTAGELAELQGIGTELKVQKLMDNRVKLIAPKGKRLGPT